VLSCEATEKGEGKEGVKNSRNISTRGRERRSKGSIGLEHRKGKKRDKRRKKEFAHAGTRSGKKGFFVSFREGSRKRGKES